MASVGRVPNAETDNGNTRDVSASGAVFAPGAASSGQGKTPPLHGHPLRAERGERSSRRQFAGRTKDAAAARLNSITRIACAGVLLAALAGCAPALGDFERPRPSVIHEDVFPFLGRQAAKHRGEPTSTFPYTDYERELRDRSWSLLMPQLERQYLQYWLAEARRTRMISVAETIPDRENYVRKLLSQDFRSSGARYQRLAMDIRNDRELYPLFIRAANMVAEFDRVRMRSLDHTADLAGKEHAEAIGRVEENRLLVWTVQTSMNERADIYRYAFQRLLLQTPDAAAIRAERELIALESELGVPGALPERFVVSGK